MSERKSFATIQDITALYRELTAAETERASALLPLVSDRLRLEAKKVGMDLDQEIANNDVLASVANGVTVDVVARVLMTPTAPGAFGPMTQISESAGGYSASGTFLNPGGGLFIKNAELAALGIRRQRYGGISVYADPRHPDNPI
ncbi:MAG: phage Gp19/Gp15/Gp42 family protein [Oscillospiraceae bacterium]|nr:phage Gp19/Gp15/Gp42 family protein [Oscillospiraceae bacterium]